MTIIDELTTEEGQGEESAATEAEIPEPALTGESGGEGTIGSDGGAGDATNATDGEPNVDSDAAAAPASKRGTRKGE
jgi:hypothetical protein